VQATFSNDLLVSSNSGFHFYSLETSSIRCSVKPTRDKWINLLRVPPKTIYSSESSRNLIGCSSYFQNDIGDRMIEFLDLRTADPTGISIDYSKSPSRTPPWITDFSFSPCGTLIQSSGADNRIFVHDIRHASQILAIFEHAQSSSTLEDVPEGEFPWDGVATEWSLDSRYLVSTADDCSIRVWDLHRSEKHAVHTISYDSSSGRSQTLALSLDHDAVSIGTSRGTFALYTL
jgi:WD40 repeat protein